MIDKPVKDEAEGVNALPSRAVVVGDAFVLGHSDAFGVVLLVEEKLAVVRFQNQSYMRLNLGAIAYHRDRLAAMGWDK